jgi:hypothetical protein
MYVPSVDNPDDICTKVVMSEQKQNHLIRLSLHDLFDCFACLIILLTEEVAGSWGGSFLHGQLNK